MKERPTNEMDLNSVLLEFRVEAASAPNPAILDAYCRKYPQYARELADYAVQWLIGDALAATANEAAPVPGSSALVSRAISRFHDRAQSSVEKGRGRTGSQIIRNPFEGLAVARKRQIRDELGLDQGLFAKFQQRLIEAASVRRELLERFAVLVESTFDEFLAYLQEPPAMHATSEFKAHKKPAVSDGKESFEEAVRKSSLDEKQKRALLRG